MIKTLFFDVGDVLLVKRVNIEQSIASHLGVSFERYLGVLDDYIHTEEAQKGWADIRTLEKEVAYMRLFALRMLERLAIPPTDARIEFIVTTRVQRDYQLVEGVYETLEALSHPYRLAIISNALVSRRHYELKQFDLEKYFDPIILSREVNMEKPVAGIFEYALAQANVQAHEAALIDNKVENLEAARALGFGLCILYNCDNTKQSQFRSVNKLEELQTVLLPENSS